MKSAFVARPQVSGSTTVPAPIGGLNAYNPLADMPKTDAVIMRNFFPEAYGCRVRRGYKEHATGLDGDVNSLLQYTKVTGEHVVYAVDASNIWDVSVPHDVTGDTPLCASAYSWWQSTNMANPAGTHMLAFNGVDDGVCVSSDGLHRLIAGDGIVAYTWENVDPKTLVVPIVHQHRLWAVQKDSTLGWYLPPEQIWGKAKSFDFGSNFARGGFLQTLAVYTQDSGYGPDDYLAAISSAGELVLYKGIDPEVSTSWSLVGVFFIGDTFTRRCACKFGGDIALLTQFGMLTIGSMAKPDPDAVLTNALSQKIQYLISQVISAAGARSGWDIMLYPNANFVVINVPGLEVSQSLQLVYNVLTKAWTVFEGMAATCWEYALNSLLFGSTGKVYRAWEEGKDNVLLDGTGGTNVVASCLQAFNYFDLPGANKHFKLVRPTFSYAGLFTYRAGANMDFDVDSLPPPANFNNHQYGIWDRDLWNSDARWSGGPQTVKQWVGVVGIGYAAAIRLGVETGSELVWASTDWVLERGGVI